MLDVTQLLDAERIKTHQHISSKKRALDTLSDLLAQHTNEDTSHMDILDSLSAREKLGSTGLGHGIALPHGRMPQLERPIAALIILTEGIDFDAPDDNPVDILFALLMPENCNDEHLQILSGLAKLFSQEELRNGIREANDAESLLERLKAATQE